MYSLCRVYYQENARRLVQGAIASCRSSGLAGAKAEHVVRINGFESGLLHDDLEAVFAGSHDVDSANGLPNAIMLPKCDSVEQLFEVCLCVGVVCNGYLYGIIPITQNCTIYYYFGLVFCCISDSYREVHVCLKG